MSRTENIFDTFEIQSKYYAKRNLQKNQFWNPDKKLAQEPRSMI